MRHYSNSFGFILACIVFLFSCEGAVREERQEAESLCLDQFEHARFNFTNVDQAHVVEEIHLNARVTFNRDKVIPYVPVIGGSVTGVHFSLGDFVRRGQLLAELRSSELAVAAKELTAATTAYELAKQEKSVARELYAGGILSGRDMLQARNALLEAMAALETARETFDIFGGSSETVKQHIVAPSHGYIVEKNVNPGMQVHAGDGPIFVLSDLSEVWVEASVYESDMARIRIGQQVRIHTLAWPDSVFTGVIDHLSNVLDPADRALRARIRVKNSDGMLKPGMYARVTVENILDKKLTTIPTNAMVFDRNAHFLIIANNDCELHTKQVHVFTRGRDKTFILDDIPPGTRIVSENQLLLYQALNY